VSITVYEDQGPVFFNISASASENSTINVTGVPHKVYPVGCPSNASITVNVSAQPVNVTFEVNVSNFTVGTHYHEVKAEANGSVLDTSLIVVTVKAVRNVELPDRINVTVESGKTLEYYPADGAKNNWNEFVNLTQVSPYPSWCTFPNVRLAPLEQKPIKFVFDARSLVPGPYSGVIRIAEVTEGGHFSTHEIELYMTVIPRSTPSPPSGTYEVTIYVRAADTNEKLSGTIIIDESVPYDFVDGERRVNLSAGSHIIEVYSSGYETAKKGISVPDQTTVLFKLNPLGQQQQQGQQRGGQQQQQGQQGQQGQGGAGQTQQAGRITIYPTSGHLEVVKGEAAQFKAAIIAKGGAVSGLTVEEVTSEPVWITASLTKSDLSRPGDFCFLVIDVVAVNVDPGNYSKTFMILGTDEVVTFEFSVSVLGQEKESQAGRQGRAPVIMVLVSDPVTGEYVSVSPGSNHEVTNGSFVHVYFSNDPRVNVYWEGLARIRSPEIINDPTAGPMVHEVLQVTGPGVLDIWVTDVTLSGEEVNLTKVQGVGRYTFRVKEPPPEPKKRFVIFAMPDSGPFYTGSRVTFASVDNLTYLGTRPTHAEPVMQRTMELVSSEPNASNPYGLPTRYVVEVVNGRGYSDVIKKAGNYVLVDPILGPVGVNVSVEPKPLGFVDIEADVVVGKKCRIPLSPGPGIIVEVDRGCVNIRGGAVQGYMIAGGDLVFIPLTEGAYYQIDVLALNKVGMYEIAYTIRITNPARRTFWDKWKWWVIFGGLFTLVVLAFRWERRLFARVRRRFSRGLGSRPRREVAL